MTTNNQDEELLAKGVDELLEQGLSEQEIVGRGYNPSLVKQRIRKRAKVGKAPPGSQSRDGSLALRKDKESVLPEWLEADVAEIFDGKVSDQKIFLAGMSVPLMGLRLFAEGVKPIIDLLATWQKGQAEAAREAQGSGIEIAQAAGEAAASGVGKFFMETKPWLSASPDPWQAMMADTMRPILQQVMGNVMGSMMRATPQRQPAEGEASPQAGAQSPPGQPKVEEASEDEIKEAFNNDQ